MLSTTTKKFRKAYEKLDKIVQRQTRASYRLFQENPYHPSLHFKNVHDNLPVYSARVNLDYRVVGILEDDTIVWFWIGPHDAYERLISRL